MLYYCFMLLMYLYQIIIVLIFVEQYRIGYNEVINNQYNIFYSVVTVCISLDIILLKQGISSSSWAMIPTYISLSSLSDYHLNWKIPVQIIEKL